MGEVWFLIQMNLVSYLAPLHALKRELNLALTCNYMTLRSSFLVITQAVITRIPHPFSSNAKILLIIRRYITVKATIGIS